MIGISYSLARPQSTKSSIRISVRFNGKRVFLYPNKSIETKNWDFKKSFLKTAQGQNTNLFLIRDLRKIEEEIKLLYDKLVFEEGLNDDSKFIKFMRLIAIGKNPVEEKQNTVISDVIEKFIVASEKGERLSRDGRRVSEKTIVAYKTMKLKFKQFEKSIGYIITSENYDEKLVDNLSLFLTGKHKYSKNGISKININLRLAIKYGIKEKLLPEMLKLIEYKTSREESDNIFLSEEEILELMNITEFKDKQHEVVRDLFVIQCMTGMRYGNISKIDFNNISDGMLKIIQVKTGDDAYIPIHRVVGEIIKKYNYKAPRCPCNATYNKILKEIGMSLESLHKPVQKRVTINNERLIIDKKKFQLIQSHTGRRSFCTNEYLRGTEPMKIMAVSGHRSFKRFMTYIKADSMARAQQLRKEWEMRGDIYKG